MTKQRVLRAVTLSGLRESWMFLWIHGAQVPNPSCLSMNLKSMLAFYKNSTNQSNQNSPQLSWNQKWSPTFFDICITFRSEKVLIAMSQWSLWIKTQLNATSHNVPTHPCSTTSYSPNFFLIFSMNILGAFQGVWNDCLPVPPIQQWWEQTSHLITEPQSGWILGSVAHCCLLVGWFSFYPPATHRWELHPLNQPLSRPPNSLLIVFNKDFQDYTGSNTHLNLCACYLNYMYSLLLLLLLRNAAECLPCYSKRKCPLVHCAVCI